MADLLRRDFTATGTVRVWTGDFTYLPAPAGDSSAIRLPRRTLRVAMRACAARILAPQLWQTPTVGLFVPAVRQSRQCISRPFPRW
ncbi:hypothetical protein [Streptomyces sp. NBC_00842]|uniref:hypothetical protein n=1 Tax=Streptomyces sp. NBC_00842 TaxID=2975848 RepID=UPI00386F7B20|nr:hypothetical protein OH821_36400 [Streptomyces sp. NBC_00842]